MYNYNLDPCGPVYITVGDGGNREKMAITHADEPGNCPEPSETPDEYMGGFCAFNFTSGPAAGKFCWDEQPEYSAYRESSFGHGILEVPSKFFTNSLSLSILLILKVIFQCFLMSNPQSFLVDLLLPSHVLIN